MVNLEISRDREEESLFILFDHNKRTMVAELVYAPTSKNFGFIRYYKFFMLIYEIHTINDILILVGEGVLGIFPYGISPNLI